MLHELPELLRINAWNGGAVPGTPLAGTWKTWATTQHMVDANRKMAAGDPADEREWDNPGVGWGLVVADDDSIPAADRAAGRDLPEPLRDLVSQRKAPILRYREELAPETLRRYYDSSPPQDLSVSATKPGIARGQMPRYLLIWASPGKEDAIGHIPWEFQYVLNTTRFTGRLHLTGDGLGRYVSALLDDWRDSGVRSTNPVVWAVDHHDQDITHLMRLTVADQVMRRLRDDADIGTKLRYCNAQDATMTWLIDALADPLRPPAMVLTTSHGMTGPLDDPVQMASDLGLLVDQNGRVLDIAALLERWRPDGAIWYTHACCSAGSDSASKFDDLVPDGQVKDILRAVASLGSRVAPLPTALLGSSRPLRAFIGHVEPTFDWTLRHPESQQPMTASLVSSLYDGMHRQRPEPVGMAFHRVFEQVGQLFAQFHFANKKVGQELNADLRMRQRAIALRSQLAALDRQACVILGDPTVSLPPLA